MKTMRLLSLLAFCACCHPGYCAAETFLRSVGVRAGQSATATENYFHQYEATAVCQLPWELRTRSGWGVATQLDAAAGTLRGEGHGGFIGSAGPGFNLGRNGFPVEMDFGVSAAVLSRDSFGNRDFNGKVQFISHIGIDFRLGEKVGLGYRFQHMSNAGMNGGANPGLNMHMLEVNWYFDQWPTRLLR